MARSIGAAAPGRRAGPQAPAAGRVLRRAFADGLRDLARLGGRLPGRVSVHTLTLARWVAVVGQLFTILLVHFSLGIPLPLALLLPAVALSGAVNVALTLRYKATKRVPERWAAALYLYDMLQLCYLLALTGGAQNPFTALLLVPIALAAATLSGTWTAVVTGLALSGLVVLTVLPGGLPWRGGPTLVLPPLYQFGISAALSIGTVLIAVFVWGLAEAARRHSDALAAAQRALAREQQMSALGGQAAAAAHLLGSPLGTITVIAKELVREMPAGAPLAEEAAELLAQSQRCREILKGLGRPADDGGHERFTAAPLTAFLEQLAAEFARPAVDVRVRLTSRDGTPEPRPAITPEVRHSLANLIDNAIQFAAGEVLILVATARSGVTLTIEDDGPGFPAEVLDWVGEPFISTRQGEGGMGLGIFIAITLLARGGAEVQFDNTARGARVTVAWPAGALDNDEPAGGA